MIVISVRNRGWHLVFNYFLRLIKTQVSKNHFRCDKLKRVPNNINLYQSLFEFEYSSTIHTSLFRPIYQLTGQFKSFTALQLRQSSYKITNKKRLVPNPCTNIIQNTKNLSERVKEPHLKNNIWLFLQQKGNYFVHLITIEISQPFL